MRKHTLADRSNANGLPAELRTWKEAVDGAYQMYAALDTADWGRGKHLAQPYSVEEKNELRQLAADAWNLYQRINAAGTRLLALWDEDACDWRTPEAPTMDSGTPFRPRGIGFDTQA